MAGGPWLAWLSLEPLQCMLGGLIRPLPVDIGRLRYRSGFVARRAAGRPKIPIGFRFIRRACVKYSRHSLKIRRLQCRDQCASTRPRHGNRQITGLSD